MPKDIPVTTPVLLTVAMDVAPLLHTPPEVVLLSGVVPPAHTIAVPVIAPATGNGLIVTITVAIHPAGNVYVIDVVPAVLPVTMPVVPMEALPLLLLHPPPVVTSVNIVVAPWHTTGIPLIADGNELTVTTVVVIQLVGRL